MDYQFVDSADAYNDANVSNSYYDRFADGAGGGTIRKLGDGGNQYMLRMALSNPLAIMKNEDFLNILKANDNRLAGINSYEGIWEMGEEARNILTDMGNGIFAYTVKQNYNEVNDLSKTKYMVTGAKELYYPIYGSGPEKNQVVEAIKNAVLNYGAAEVFTFYDEDNCVVNGGWDGQTHDGSDVTHTIIERTNYNPSTGELIYGCNTNTGHALTIVGWNDDFVYNDGQTAKTGAFIIQNSWGDTFWATTDDFDDKHFDKYYMGYDSAFDVMYFDSIETTESYDNIHSIDDYKSNETVPGSDEYVFEFTADDNEELKEISFNQNFYSSENYDVYVGTTAAANNFVKVGAFTAYMGTTRYQFSSPVIVSGNFAVKLKKTSGENIDETIERKINILNVYTNNTDREPSIDPDHTDEPTDIITWVQGRNYVIGSNKDLIVKVDYPRASLIEVDVDGDVLAADNFKVESGSTILTIYSSFLDTLDDGSHTIQLLYSDKTIETNFTVSTTFPTDDSEEDIPVPNTAGGATSPVTGRNTDNSETSLVAFSYALPVFVVAIALGYFTYKHKKRVCFDHK